MVSFRTLANSATVPTIDLFKSLCIQQIRTAIQTTDQRIKAQLVIMNLRFVIQNTKYILIAGPDFIPSLLEMVQRNRLSIVTITGNSLEREIQTLKSIEKNFSVLREMICEI